MRPPPGPVAGVAPGSGGGWVRAVRVAEPEQGCWLPAAWSVRLPASRVGLSAWACAGVGFLRLVANRSVLDAADHGLLPEVVVGAGQLVGGHLVRMGRLTTVELNIL